MPIKKLLKHQQEIGENLSKLVVNIKKDPRIRKTADYVIKKREFTNAQWDTFRKNHENLEPLLKADHEYIKSDFFQQVQDVVNTIEEYLTEIQQQTPREENVFNFNPTVNPVEPARKINMTLNRQMIKLKMLSSAIRNVEQPISPEMALEDYKYCRNDISTQWRQIQEFHETILAEQTPEGEDYENSGKYEEMESEVKIIMFKLQQIIERAKTPHSHTRLPPVTIPKFSGDYESWISFHDIFVKLVHEDCGLSKVEKLKHLKSNITGEASKILRHLQITEQNYDSAWDLLNRRYNNKRKLAGNYMDNILKLPKLNNASANALKEIHDTTQESLLALDNLGVENDTWGPIIGHILLEKLDKDTKTLFEQSMDDPKEIPHLGKLLDFLEARFQSLEMMVEDVKQYETKPNKLQYMESNKKTPWAAKSYSSITNSCNFCKENHQIYRCEKFLELRPTERNEFIVKNNWCSICLTHPKSTKCNNNRTCFKCKKTHNTLLHIYEQKVEQQATTSAAANISVKRDVTSVIDNPTDVLLATALVQVQTCERKWELCRALIDLGSQTSFVTEETAELLGLPRTKVCVNISGVGSTGAGTSHSKINAAIKPRSPSSFTLNCELLVLKQLTSSLPTAPINQNIEEMNNRLLADPTYNTPGPINIIIGADIFSVVAKEGLIKLKMGYLAQNTEFGWILTGKSSSDKPKTAFSLMMVADEKLESSKSWEKKEIKPICKCTNKQKIYGQIKIQKSDHNLHKILEKETQAELIQENASTTVTYGTAAAPFLVVKTLQQLADDKKEVYPHSAEKMYSDSAAVSIENTEKIIEILHDKELSNKKKINLETTVRLEENKNNKTARIKAMEQLNIVNKFTSVAKVIRVMAYCKKFINNCKREKREEGQKLGQFLTTSELINDGRVCINKEMQSQHYSTEINALRVNESSSAKNSTTLSSFLDKNIIPQNRGRLGNSEINNNVLKIAERSEVFPLQNIIFHFTPPAAPHFGGFWKAGVKTTKFHLNKIFGDTTLTFKAMSTVLYQTRASFNSKLLGANRNNDQIEEVASPYKIKTRSRIKRIGKILAAILIYCCFLITTVQSSSYSIKHPTPGLYVEHIGHAVLDRGVLRIDVPINRTMLTVHDQMINETIKKYSALCTHSQQLGADSFCNDEVSEFRTRHTELKRQMYVIQHGYNSRRKRGLLGTILTSVFGVNDEVYTDIDQLDKNQKKLIETAQHQTHIMLKTVQSLNTTEQRINEKLKQFTRKLNLGLEKLDQLDHWYKSTDINSLLIHLENIRDVADGIITQLEHIYSKLLRVVHHEGHIIDFLTIEEFHRIISTTKIHLPSHLTILTHPMKKMDITTTEGNITLHVHLHITEIPRYTIMSVTPIPEKIKENIFTAATVDTPLIAVDYDDQNYFPITELDLHKSVTLGNNNFLYSPPFIHDVNKNPNCVVDTVFSRTLNNCGQRKFTVAELLWKQLYLPNTWMFVAATPTRVSLRCHGHLDDIWLNHTGIIQINDTCTLDTGRNLLKTKMTSKVSGISSFHKPLNISLAIKQADIPVHKYSNIAQEPIYQAHEEFASILHDETLLQENLATTTWETIKPHAPGIGIGSCITILLIGVIIGSIIWVKRKQQPFNFTLARQDVQP